MLYPIGFTYKWAYGNSPIHWITQKVIYTNGDERTFIVTNVPENSDFCVGEELTESIEEIERYFRAGQGTIVPSLRRRNNL